MPRVFFHLLDQSECLMDEQGAIVDLSEVPARALKDARSIIADDVLTGVVNMDYSIEVRDEAGRTVHILSFRDAVMFIGLD